MIGITHKTNLALCMTFAMIIASNGVLAQTPLLPFTNASTGKMGYVNNEGHVVISPSYDKADEFSDGLAAVTVGDKKGYIDEKGEFAIITNSRRLDPFSEGLALSWVDESHYGYIDKEGKLAIPPKFSFGGSYAYRRFTEGRARVEQDKKWGFLNRAGELAINPLFDTAEEFHGGRAVVTHGGKSAFIDIGGRLFKNENFESIGRFSEGVAPVKINGKWGYIDTEGSVVIAPIFHYASEFSEGRAAVETRSADPKKDRLWGYIDRGGTFVITPQFDEAEKFSEGLAAVRPKGSKLYGYIDSSGRIEIRPAYSVAGAFSGGNAKVQFPDVLTIEGRPLQSRDDLTFLDKYSLAVQLNSSFGYINKQGSLLFVWSTARTNQPDFCDFRPCLGGTLVNFGQPPKVAIKFSSNPPNAEIFLVPYLAFDLDNSIIADAKKMAAYVVQEGRTPLSIEVFSQKYLVVFRRGQETVTREIAVYPKGPVNISVEF